MFSLRIAAVTLLSLLLWACSIDDQQPPSQVSITFYPPQIAFLCSPIKAQQLAKNVSFEPSNSQAQKAWKSTSAPTVNHPR